MRLFPTFVLFAIVVAFPWQVFSQPVQQETIVLQRPEEYQLRLLESQIQMLRNKLYAQQKMDDQRRSDWLQHYNEVAKRLQSWNKFQGAYNIE